MGLAAQQFDAAESAVLEAIGFDASVAAEAKAFLNRSFYQSKTERLTLNPGTGKIDSETTLNPAICFKIKARDFSRIYRQFSEKWKAKGYLLFRSEVNFGYSDDELTILKSSDQFDILRIMQTDGINYDITNEDLITKLMDFDSRFGLRIYGAGQDFVEAFFVGKPEDMMAFAEELYEFCPDIVDQGTDTVEALASEMERTKILYLWWD
jgi:hypothetical protein